MKNKWWVFGIESKFLLNLNNFNVSLFYKAYKACYMIKINKTSILAGLRTA